MPTAKAYFPDKIPALLRGLKEQGLWRRRESRTSPAGPWVEVGSERLLTFSSNDYLGLANDPRIVEALCAGARRYGVGAGASHLLGGHTRAHHELEEELAAFVGAPRALVFSTGYMANLALLTTLGGRRQTVFEDRRNHASLLDAARLAGSECRRYRQVEDLAERVRGTEGGLIVTDGVFSMDGDIALVPALLTLAKTAGLGLIVDDAHGFGVIGPQGKGTPAFHGLAYDPVLVHMGTLGKAFGVFGAFVAASADIIEALIQKARPYIYTTALPPAVAAAAHASIEIARLEEYRRVHLTARIQQFRDGARALGLNVLPSHTAIQPLILGTSEQALQASAHLRSRQLLVSAVRPPTVPVGSARLRIALSAAHSTDDVARLLEGLATLPLDKA